MSSFLIKALASWGFVVVAPSHPGDTIFDGVDSCDFDELRAPTLVQRVADVRAVIDALENDGSALGPRFAGRVRRSRIGVLGWSSGGSTAIIAAREDARIRAALSLAPDARPERLGTRPLRAPAMVMGGELDYYDPEQTALDRVWPILLPPRFAVHLWNTGHFAFSDDCFADLVDGEDCRPGALTQAEAHALVLRFAVPFLLRFVDEDRRWDAFLRPDAIAEDVALLRAQLPRPDRVAVGR